MPNNPSLHPWLDPLRRLMPPVGVVHVGAGTGLAVSRYGDWGVAAALFVEAEEGLRDKLARVLKPHPGWLCRAALLGGREEERDFYVASNPAESGILPPESLAGLWRNLKTRERRRLHATTLAALLANVDCPPQTFNWAVVDCLPALPVIQGAGGHLDGFDVIMARVVMDAGQLPGCGATKPELDAFLGAQGFYCLAFQEERQPAVGSAIYVRDWKRVLGQRLADSQGEALRQALESAGTVARLENALGGQIEIAAERQWQVEQLTQALGQKAELADGLGAKLAAAQDEAVQLNARIDDQAQQNGLALLQLHQIQEEHESCLLRLQTLEQSHATAQAKIAADAARLAAQAEQIGQLARERDGQAALAAELKVRLGQAAIEDGQGGQILDAQVARFSDARFLTIVSEDSRAAWDSEFETIPLAKDTYAAQIADTEADAALIESAMEPWQGSAVPPGLDDPQTLLDAVAKIKAKGIPAVFWDQRFPADCVRSLPVAKFCDRVFVSDPGALGEYQRSLPETKVVPAPFAASPRVFNPSGRHSEKPGTVCLFGACHSSNASGMAMDAGSRFFPVVKALGGTFYDTVPPPDGRSYPAAYRDHLKELPPLAASADSYRHHKLLLNADPPSVVPRRVVEALACGTPVVSVPSQALEEAFSGIVQMAADAEEATAVCGRLLSDEWEWLRLSHRGYREVMLKDTYRQRAGELLGSLGVGTMAKPPLVSIIMATMRPHMIDRIAANVGGQTYGPVELIVVTQGYSGTEAARLKEALGQPGNLSRLVVIEGSGSATLGARLNFAIAESRGDYVAKMDDDDLYFPHYLQDMLMPFSFGDYGIVGKREMFVYLEGQNKTYLRSKGYSHKSKQFVAGATFVIKRGILSAIGFADSNHGEDSALLHAASRLGIEIYAADPFNFVVWRAPYTDAHTWKVDDNYFLENGVEVGDGIPEGIIAV